MYELFFLILIILIFFIDYARKDNKISNLKNKINDLNILYKKEKDIFNIINENNIHLIEKNKQIIIKKEQTIKDYKQKIIKLNEVITSLKYSTKNNIDYSIKSLNEDNSNTWKNKYEELNKKYIQTHDEVIYLRRTYDKEHAKLISLENELEIAHKKIIELQKNNLQKYRKEDIENINDWRKFEQFIAKQFKIKNFIECKYWNSNKTIGREEIQKLAGTAMMDGVKNAIFITTSTYNENAFETARALNKNGFNINLWTTKDLLAFINK